MSSVSAGESWGEYIEVRVRSQEVRLGLGLFMMRLLQEYEASLCVSLDIDHGYRWDTR